MEDIRGRVCVPVKRTPGGFHMVLQVLRGGVV